MVASQSQSNLIGASFWAKNSPRGTGVGQSAPPAFLTVGQFPSNSLQLVVEITHVAPQICSAPTTSMRSLPGQNMCHKLQVRARLVHWCLSGSLRERLGAIPQNNLKRKRRNG